MFIITLTHNKTIFKLISITSGFLVAREYVTLNFILHLPGF